MRPWINDATSAHNRTKMTVLLVVTNVYIQEAGSSDHWWGIQTIVIIFCIHETLLVRFSCVNASYTHVQTAVRFNSPFLLFSFGCMRSEPQCIRGPERVPALRYLHNSQMFRCYLVVRDGTAVA